MKAKYFCLVLLACITQCVAAEPIDELLKSAESGDENAMLRLGRYYKHGSGGIEKDENEAVIWFRKLADKGSPWGQYSLGDCFREGSGVAQNYETAFYWYKKAAEQGDGSAQYRLARCYYDGQGVEKNKQESFKWMAKAAESNSMGTFLDLGLYYAAGIGTPINIQKSIGLIHRAAENNSAMAQCILGLCYIYGNGVAHNLKDGMTWLCKAAESFSMQGGDFNDSNISGPLISAALEGNPTLLTAFGIYLHRSGTDFPELKEKATELAEQGNLDMQYLLGVAYMSGMGVERNKDIAIKWFNTAATNGHKGAKAFVASYGTNDNEATAASWFREEGEKGDTDALVALGFCYSTGVGVARDEQKAIDLYLKAAEQNNARAQFLMCIRYGHGLGVAEDNEKANIWFKRALDNKYRKAVLLATPLSEIVPGTTLDTMKDAGFDNQGDGVEEDSGKSANWYRKAADSGSKEAQYNLGICYATGNGVERDISQAVIWIRKAAEQGLNIAHANLAMRYRNGEGVLQDDQKACVHFLIAGALGYPDTSLFVDELRDARLSAAQYIKAQRMANDWIEKFRKGGSMANMPEDKPVSAILERRLPNTGSGFVISSNGYFLTCAHVVEEGREIKVQLGTITYSAKLIRADAHNDVALLKLDGADFQPLALSQSLPEMGDKVFTVGFPNPELQGASAKYTDGSISSLSGILDDIRTMQITVPIQGGNSGGPLVDESGNALGLVLAQLNAAAVFEYTGTIPQNVNFAIKIGYALPLVQSVPDLARNLPQPRMANPDARPVDEVQAAIGLVLVYE